MADTEHSLPEPISEWEMIGRIFGAAALAGLVGFEREFKNKPANVRMHCLVGAGAATFVGVALMNTNLWRLGDVNRVPAGVASGVGFLGAGTIFKINDRVSGLTTAAGIWICASIGYAVAAGYWLIGIFVALLVLVVQFGFLFFLSPHFWQDFREKFQITYDMEERDMEVDNNNEEQEERRTMLGSRRSSNSSSPPSPENIESGEAGSIHVSVSSNSPDKPDQAESDKAVTKSNHRE